MAGPGGQRSSIPYQSAAVGRQTSENGYPLLC